MTALAPVAGRGDVATGGRLLLTGAAQGDVLVVDGRIAALGQEAADHPAAGDAQRVEADGLSVAPGFIELQVNGAAGHDLTTDPASTWAVGEYLARHGVTAFLPTIVTSPPAVVDAALAILAAGPPAGWRGAIPLGLHIEGPFLSPDRSGAHDPALLRQLTPELAAGWAPESGVRLVTLAPELHGALELIADLAGRGVVVSAGHSAASLDDARAAFDAGVRYVTHLFNAMPPLDHRAPGLAVAALLDDRVTVGLIPDGVHSHPAMVELAWRVAGPGRVSIVTDAIAALGMPPGRYPLGGREVLVEGESARLADGRLAGAVLGLDRALRNLCAFAGASAADALRAVTDVPARLLGLDDRGVLRVGARADLVLLTPALEVVETYVDGRPLLGRA